MLPTQELVRRGIDAYNSASRQGNEDPTQNFQLSTWGGILIGITFLLFLISDFIIEYTFGRVIPTLLKVESPQAILFEPLKSDDPDAPVNKKGDVEPELLLVKQQPITASFKATIKHLRARAGKQSHLRGLGVYFVNNFVFHWCLQILSLLLPTIFAFPLATILCAPFSMAWTHIVISDPSPLRWYKRVPNYATIKKVLPATAIYALAREAVFVLPTYLAVSFRLLEEFPQKMTTHRATIMCLQGTSVLVLFGALSFLVLIPASVILTRVQASLLADNEESIVPFDRTFGGRVASESVGGTGVLGTLDAWKTFDWNSRVRLLKAYFKVAAMEVALTVVFILVLVGQALLILGEDRKKIVIGRDAAGNPKYLDF